jgi:hypothetical protein
VIEHHLAAMGHAGWIIGLGPGAGHAGWRIAFKAPRPTWWRRGRRRPASTWRHSSSAVRGPPQLAERVRVPHPPAPRARRPETRGPSRTSSDRHRRRPPNAGPASRARRARAARAGVASTQPATEASGPPDEFMRVEFLADAGVQAAPTCGSRWRGTTARPTPLHGHRQGPRPIPARPGTAPSASCRPATTPRRWDWPSRRDARQSSRSVGGEESEFANYALQPAATGRSAKRTSRQVRRPGEFSGGRIADRERGVAAVVTDEADVGGSMTAGRMAQDRA